MWNTPNKALIYISAISTAFIALIFRVLSSSFQTRLNCTYQDFNYIAAAIMIFVLFIFAKRIGSLISNNFDAFMAGLILGGGVFNALERLYTGCVVDYFNVNGLFFNVADALIVLSTMYFAFIVLKLRK